MFSKSVLAFVLSFSATAAFAQGSTNTMPQNASTESSRIGLGVSAMYSNLTSFSTTTEYTFLGRKETETNNGSSSNSDIAGIRGSYRFGVGYTMALEPGFSIMKRINKPSDEGDATIFTIDTNFAWGFTDSLELFAGPSVSKFDVQNKSSDVTIDLGLGLQFGLGYQKNGMLVKVGYADYGYGMHASGPGYDVKTTARIGGFTGQVGYLF